MDWDLYRTFLLNNIPGAEKKSGGKEVNCRCRECPDSNDTRSKHMYISIPQDQSTPSEFYCHKCGCRGIVTHSKLIEWGIFDRDIGDMLIKYNKEISHNPINKKYFNHYTYQIRHTQTTQDSKSEEKRQYIVQRIGHDLSFDDLQRLKICVNLLDVLRENDIRKFTRDNNIINDLDREFIGFLSVDNAFLNMRRTCKEGLVYSSIDNRYINYRIFDKQDTAERFYTIPTTINLNRPERLKIHIAEGPFDILSIYLNLRHGEDGIYTSIAGNNPIAVANYFLSICMTPWIEIHYYADNDKFGNVKRIRWLMSQLPDKFPLYIHRNIMSGQKDFGVSLCDIKEDIKEERL